MNMKKYLKPAVILLVVSVIYTILVKVVDVSAIGPNGSKVGFATINNWFHQLFPYSETWYKTTKYLGLLPFLLVGYYGCYGLYQSIKRRDILKMDKQLLLLGIFYLMVAATYILFEAIVINYRPVLMDGVLEASYPSSHTMLAICVCASSLMISKYYFKNDFLRELLDLGTWLLMIILVVGRAISGVHWISDIVGGVLISGFLIALFYESISKIRVKKSK